MESDFSRHINMKKIKSHKSSSFQIFTYFTHNIINRQQPGQIKFFINMHDAISTDEKLHFMQNYWFDFSTL